MAETVTSLEIKIEENTRQASSGINKLNSALKKLKDTLGDDCAGLQKLASVTATIASSVSQSSAKISGAVSSVGDATKKLDDNWGKVNKDADKQVEQIRKQSIKFGEAIYREKEGIHAFSDAMEELKGYMNTTKQFAKDKTAQQIQKMVKPIKELTSALGRIAMYRALRSIIKAITEGIKEGLDNLYLWSRAWNTDFYKSMDRATTAMTYFKNSIGSVVAPLINYFVPTLEKIVDYLVDVNNQLAQLFASLSGATTFEKAKKVTVQYTEALSKLNGQLMKFDELNIISKKQSSYYDMFETAEIDNNTVSKLESILTLVKTIGIAFVTWKLSSGFINQVGELGTALGIEGVAGAISKIQTGLAGLLVVSVGLAFSYDAGKNIGLAGTDKDSIQSAYKEFAVGIVASAIGGALVGGSIGSAFGPGGTVMGGVIGAIIGVSLSTMIMGIGMKKGAEQAFLNSFDKTELGQKIAEIHEKIDSESDITANLKVKLDTITGDIDSDTLGKLQQASELVAKIFTLNDKDNLTSTELDTLKGLVAEFNGLGLDGIKLEFDETTNRVVQTRQEVEKLIKALTDEYKLTALSDAIGQAYVAQVEATASQERLRDLVTELSRKQATQNGKYASAKAELTLAEKAYNKWASKQSSDSWSRTGQYIGKDVETYRALIKAKQDAEEKSEKERVAYEKISAELETAKTQYAETTEIVNKAKQKVEDLTSALNDLKTAMVSVNETGINIGTSGNSKGKGLVGNSVSVKASGGFVDRGQLFVANEAGPEMVASLDGKTAVANNDMITTAIASAVYEAMMSANSGGTSVVIEGDMGKFLRAVKRANYEESLRVGV